jgi:hypothetical protein
MCHVLLWVQMQQPQEATVTFVNGQTTAGTTFTDLVGVQRPTVIAKFHRKQSVGIGITLIVSALFSFAFNSAELGVGLNSSYSSYTGFVWGVIGHGYWTGTMVG